MRRIWVSWSLPLGAAIARERVEQHCLAGSASFHQVLVWLSLSLTAGWDVWPRVTVHNIVRLWKFSCWELNPALRPAEEGKEAIQPVPTQARVVTY